MFTVGPVRPAAETSLAALDDVARGRVASAAAAAQAANTRMTYASQWNRFAAWCDRHGVVDPLDAGAAQVAAYLAERAETRKLATVQASAAAIAAAYRAAGRADPTKTPLVADTLRGIARQHAAVPEAAPRQAAALDYATAIDLMQMAGRPQPRGRGRETPGAAAARGRRDAAIVALAFCAGLRRSEIAALVWGDITPTARAGQLRVRVRASKANADGRREDPPAARRPLRPRRRAAANGDVARRGRAHRPARPAPGQPPPAGPGHHARPRWRLVALRPPGPGLGARPPRRVDHRRAGRRRLAQRLDGRPLRVGRRSRGRRRRQALRYGGRGRISKGTDNIRVTNGAPRKRRSHWLSSLWEDCSYVRHACRCPFADRGRLHAGPGRRAHRRHPLGGRAGRPRHLGPVQGRPGRELRAEIANLDTRLSTQIADVRTQMSRIEADLKSDMKLLKFGYGPVVLGLLIKLVFFP